MKSGYEEARQLKVHCSQLLLIGITQKNIIVITVTIIIVFAIGQIIVKSRGGPPLWLWAELMLLYGDSAEPPPPPMQSLWWKFPATDTNTKYYIFVEKLNIRYVKNYKNCNHCKEVRTNVLLSDLYHEFCALNEPNLIFKQVATMYHQNHFFEPMFIL